MMELHNYGFSMTLRGGYHNDVWMLSGNVYGRIGYNPGDKIHVSTPRHFDEENEIVTTYSGSKYKLINPNGNKDEIFKEIKNVIRRGYYSRH